jgi:hypothetical protein
MNKKVIFNGIELSLPKYNESAVTIFDYLDKIVTNLQDGLSEDDGNFQLSIDVDFSTTKSPKHKIQSSGSTPRKTKEKVARILEKTADKKSNHVSGSVRVNLLIEDRE